MSQTKTTAVATAQATTQVAPRKTLNEIMNSTGVITKLNDVLGDEKTAAGFISSVISVANGNKELRKAEPMSVVASSMVAATLQLPIVPTLGLAYIVPYKGQAQFQIGYKGLIELAERSGQFKAIIDEAVYEGQLIKKNKFTGEYIFDEDAKKSDTVIGYMARFDLINGFSKTIYWSIEEVKAHALKFSQAYKNGWNCPWKTDFDAMARKTVLKALFSKYAPKSIQMQNAITFDQAVLKTRQDITSTDTPINIDAFDVEYIDNPEGGAYDEEVAEATKAKAEAIKTKVQAAKAKAVKVDTETGEVEETPADDVQPSLDL